MTAKRLCQAHNGRYLILKDKHHGMAFLEKLVKNHVSGQLKVAPEHCETQVLQHMGKQTMTGLLAFKQAFDRLSARCGKSQFLTYYFMAAHPGCTRTHMAALKRFTRDRLNIPRAGPDLHPHPVHLFHAHVLHRPGPFHRQPHICGKRSRQKTAAERHCHSPAPEPVETGVAMTTQTDISGDQVKKIIRD